MFEKREIYCNYYRVYIEDFLPEEAKNFTTDEKRYFVYRTPFGYNQEFIKSDLGILLNDTKLQTSQKCEVKPLQPLIQEVKNKYNIDAKAEGLYEESQTTKINKMIPPKFINYFKQNYKRQFYVE